MWVVSEHHILFQYSFFQQNQDARRTGSEVRLAVMGGGQTSLCGRTWDKQPSASSHTLFLHSYLCPNLTSPTHFLRQIPWMWCHFFLHSYLCSNRSFPTSFLRQFHWMWWRFSYTLKHCFCALSSPPLLLLETNCWIRCRF